MTARGVWHAGLTVSDFDTAIAFYRDLLGFELSSRRMVHPDVAPSLSGYPDAEIEVAFLDLPDGRRVPGAHDLELVQYRHPHREGQTRERAAAGSPHLAILVDDADAEYQRLSAAGVQFVSPPNPLPNAPGPAASVCYFYGPDGVTLELVGSRSRSDTRTA